MEYKNHLISLNTQEKDDLDCGNFPDSQLDEVIASTELLLGMKTARLNHENRRIFGGTGERHGDENQVNDPQVYRLRTALHDLEIIKLERDANRGF